MLISFVYLLEQKLCNFYAFNRIRLVFEKFSKHNCVGKWYWFDRIVYIKPSASEH